MQFNRPQVSYISENSIKANGKFKTSEFYMINRGTEAECICLQRKIRSSPVMMIVFGSILILLILLYFIDVKKESTSGQRCKGKNGDSREIENEKG